MSGDSEESTPAPADPPAPSGTPESPTPQRPPSANSALLWAALIGGLAVLGILLALADIALGSATSFPVSGLQFGPGVIATPNHPVTPGDIRFDRNRLNQRFLIAAPFGLRKSISPFEGVRIFLSSGAGLVLLALAALLVFPTRSRKSVEHLEAGHGTEIALAAGVAAALLTLAAVTLLRFTLVFLAVIPAVLVVVLAAALFGVACISLAIGRLLTRRLSLPGVHPLVAALAGALVVFDLSVVPFVGIFVLALVAITGFGLAVVTRFGSPQGWSFGDLSW